MALYCDVALPVPLDHCFTYSLAGLDVPPRVGERVIAPFRGTKLIGVVTRLHDDDPGIETRPLDRLLDSGSALPAELMELGQWVSRYYLAPPGEVFRSMLPLAAEVRSQTLFRITQTGKEVLFAGASQGSSRRSRLSSEEQNIEYAVLDYLSNDEPANRALLRRATGATTSLLRGMVRKKWLVWETEAKPRNALRAIRVAVLAEAERPPKLNENQLEILAALAGAGGMLRVDCLRRLSVPASTLGTLVRRGLVRIEERPAEFELSGLTRPAGEFLLNDSQQAALSAIRSVMDAHTFGVHLLHGVTGSGKTAVYLAAMRIAMESGRSAILLVPEIGLTPAMAAELHSAFGAQAALLHSALTLDERAEQWRRIRSGEARIVVGTRSAVFAPVADLGLVIVDEEHDSSYKQEEMPRYHARDVAVMRARAMRAAVLLGSATPSLESWQNVRAGKYALIEMPERVNFRPLPEVELVDMRKEFEETGQEALFSRTLIERTRETLDRGEQAIILLNRRGYSFVVLCRACGEKLQCENCAIALTHHKPLEPEGDRAPRPAGQRLKCHYCGFARTVPRHCPACQSEHLFYLGAGSQQGEERLRELFPEARIGRMDRDSVRGHQDMERLLADMHSGRINLMVGTQMLAKGHDIHGVTLVGVVGADYALGLPDFRAAERVFQLLTQVSGRAGRGELRGRVLVQTYHPDHYAIQCAAENDVEGFLRREMRFRKLMHYPPYCALANILIQAPQLEQAADWAHKLGRWFAEHRGEGVRVLGPATAPISRIKRLYRFHLLIKATRRQALSRVLVDALEYAAAAGISRRSLLIDVDPIHLM